MDGHERSCGEVTLPIIIKSWRIVDVLISHGDLVVRTVAEHKFANFTERRIQLRQGNLSREISQAGGGARFILIIVLIMLRNILAGID